MTATRRVHLLLSCAVGLLQLVQCSPVSERTAKAQLSLYSRSRSIPKFSSVIVFGDSFSDNGNGTWQLTNHTWPADSAYYNGRFSNGPVWVESLRTLVGANQLLDFAFGGATINNSIVAGYTGVNSTIPVPAVVDQVGLFLNASLSRAEPCSTLSILLAGINDGYFASSSLDVPALTDSLLNAVKQLVAKGFRTFLLPTNQAGALLPYYTLYSSAADRAAQEQFSQDFHGNLSLSIRAAGLPRDVHLYRWDEYGAIADLIQQGNINGFEVQKPCLSGVYGEVANRTLCDDPDRHVFFDIFHPTKISHQAIAKNVAALLAS